MKQLRKLFEKAVSLNVKAKTNMMCLHQEIASGTMKDGRKFRYLIAMPNGNPVFQVSNKDWGWSVSYFLELNDLVETLERFVEKNPVNEKTWSTSE